MTTQDVLISVVFAILVTCIMTLAHSLVLLFYVGVLYNVIFSIYWSTLGYAYKKKYLQLCSQLQQGVKKEEVLSGGWWAGWFPMVGAICCFFMGLGYQLTPMNVNTSAYEQAALCGVAGFVIGFAYPIAGWWLWRKYRTAVNRFV
ncbi:MAG TPA: hypothetical protein VFV38_35050 [Ktedonobacteraceae bacterium]|nr:hypothetical protein [Ktedonobacteraceae bacterium]